MKNSYISEVRRKLKLPRGKKREVMRDLEEIFATAEERGESKDKLVLRLGTPEEYARETEAAFGVDGARLRRKRLAVLAFAFAFVAVVALAFARGRRLRRVRGYADNGYSFRFVGDSARNSRNRYRQKKTITIRKKGNEKNYNDNRSYFAFSGRLARFVRVRREGIQRAHRGARVGIR